jgi:hypothetical protein
MRNHLTVNYYLGSVKKCTVHVLRSDLDQNSFQQWCSKVHGAGKSIYRRQDDHDVNILEMIRKVHKIMKTTFRTIGQSMAAGGMRDDMSSLVGRPERPYGAVNGRAKQIPISAADAKSNNLAPENMVVSNLKPIQNVGTALNFAATFAAADGLAKGPAKSTWAQMASMGVKTGTSGKHLKP